MYRPFDGVEERFLSQVSRPCLASHPRAPHLTRSAAFTVKLFLFDMMMHHTAESAPKQLHACGGSFHDSYLSKQKAG